MKSARQDVDFQKDIAAQRQQDEADMLACAACRRMENKSRAFHLAMHKKKPR
jgi:hypothetical protein